jgi:flagellar protein FliL
MSDETPAAEPATDAAAPTPKKGKPGVVLIGALVGGLVAGVAGGLFGVGPMVARSSGYVVTPEMQARLKALGGDSTAGDSAGHDAAADTSEHAAAGSAEHGEGGAPGSAANLQLVDNLVLNPAGSGGTRFLMLTAAIEFSESALVDQFKARDAEVRDLVLRVMGAKTVEQLSDMQQRETLRKEMIDSLTLLLPKAQRKKGIARLFFPQFVIQ